VAAEASFGKSEGMLGQALGARRKDIVLATKVLVRLEPGTNKAGFSRRHVLEACEASLRRLGTDYIDPYQAHNFDSLTPLDESLHTFRARQALTPSARKRLESWFTNRGPGGMICATITRSRPAGGTF